MRGYLKDMYAFSWIFFRVLNCISKQIFSNLVSSATPWAPSWLSLSNCQPSTYLRSSSLPLPAELHSPGTQELSSSQQQLPQWFTPSLARCLLQVSSSAILRYSRSHFLLYGILIFFFVTGVFCLIFWENLKVKSWIFLSLLHQFLIPG